MKDWIIHYVKAKDIFLKNLNKYDIKENIIEFDFGNHKQIYLFHKELNKEIIEKIKKFSKKTLVCEKNEKNFDFLRNNFKELSNMNNFMIIFLSKDKKNKVIINPNAHSIIADPETLDLGLKAIWNSS